ncbi:MAG TPA: membrane protein insertase YidC [Vicinamibacterales bacterium]|nr:membrane protein insertase YidC [Vicinamibacterales bacterium]
MERRVLLAISLSFVVLFLFQQYVVPPPAPINTSASAPAAPAAPAGTAAATSAAPAPVATGPAAPPAPAAPTIAATVTESAAREIVVETTKVRAVFANRGATLVHWILKEYRDDNGQALDLVPAGAGGNVAKPFTLAVDDAAVTARLTDAIYRVTVDDAPAGAMVDATASPKTIVFETAAADGLHVRKTFGVEPTSYIVTFGALVQMGSQRLNPVIQWGPGLGDDIARTPPSSFFSPAATLPAQAIAYRDGDVDRMDPTVGGAQEGPFKYAGVDDHYFASILLNDVAGRNVRIDYQPHYVPLTTDPSITGKYVNYSVRFPAPQDSVRFFFGPKVFEDLRAIDPELTRAMNFGIFSWLAVPLLGALKWVQGFVGNWGWSIVVLTILINLAMFPLRHKSVVSMRKMQEIQPQMKAIQERYAKYKITDPERQKMNTEVMELYKAKGVNPASGCVPMLLTLPFLIAFYSMLQMAIEIRGANFMGWITNLSAPDPYFILPVAMGAVQFWQTKMQPMGGDPTQQKIMMVMPLMFALMSFSFPSGLVLYWLVSTLFTIVQQYFTNYLIGAPPRPAVK